jgi:hypothetical protein
MDQERLKQIKATYASMQPLIRDIARCIRPGVHMLDVGSAEGVLALKMAEDFKVEKLFLTDNQRVSMVHLPDYAESRHVDALSNTFIDLFQNKVELVTCIRTFHEFNEVLLGVHQLVNVLPLGGTLVLMECTYKGWEQQWKLSRTEGPLAYQHTMNDLNRASRNGLLADEDIRNFWEQRCFPGMPGECELLFCDELYVVIYRAREWYDVKEPPEWMRVQIDENLRSRGKALK